MLTFTHDNVKANKALLSYLVETGKDKVNLKLNNLVNNTDFVNATNFSLDDPIDKNTKEDLSLVNRLEALEELYDVIFKIPKTITKEDMDDIYHFLLLSFSV